MTKVCLDAGHGVKDPGAVGPIGLKEKDVVLAVSLKTGRKLKNSGIEVVYTRVNDNPDFPRDEQQNLARRVSIANTSRVDCFISIHCNSATNKTAHGTETYCVQLGYNAEKLARAIQTEVVRATGLSNRGVKTANFYVLEYTQMPAALIELAFISNPNEEKLLADEGFQDEVAGAIAKGICNYLGVKYMPEKSNEKHWAEKHYESLNKKGVEIHEKRFDDNITRGEVFALLDRIVK